MYSKSKASGSPPHNPYDNAITLLPRTTTPRSKVYPTSLAEQCTTEEYIQEALQLGYILLQLASSSWRTKGVDFDPALISGGLTR